MSHASAGPLPLFEQALAHLNDVVLITEAEPVDRPGPRIVFVNPAFERMTGYTAQEVLGQCPRLLQGPRTSRSELNRLRVALSRWESVQVSLTNYSKRGTPFDVEFDVVPIADDRGRFTHWVSIQRDVTTRTLCANIIEHAASVDALAIGVLHDLVEYTDASGGRISHRDDATSTWQTRARTVRTADESLASTTMTRDLSIAGRHELCIHLWFADEPPASALRLLEAVSERASPAFAKLLAERDRDALEERLRQAQKLEAIGRLAGGIAHDFNNLLTIIVGNLELIRDNVSLGTEAQHDMNEVVRATDRARELIQHLLAFSRQRPLDLRRIDVGAVVVETTALLRRALGAGVTIHAKCGDELPSVMGDAVLLEQALINLAVNARDAIMSVENPRGGSIAIDVSLTNLSDRDVSGWERLSPGAHVCLTVTDDGPGMSADVRARAFDPFFTTKAVGAGTGLGLSSVYGAIVQMGGAIRLEVAEPTGTIVRMLLPIAPVERSRIPAAPVVASLDPNGAILLVDDEDAVRAIVARLLTANGYRVIVARHAEEALTLWEAHETEIVAVISDVRMPGTDGVSLVRDLRRRRPGLPVLLVSGFLDEQMKADMPRDAATIRKPFTRSELLEAVDRLLSVANPA